MEMTAKALDAISVPAFIISRDHKVLAWNVACSLLTGIASESVIGTNRHWTPFYRRRRPTLADLVVENATDNLAKHYAQFGRAQFAFDAYKAEGWFDNLNGKRRYLVFEARPLVSEGQIVGALETLQDVTDYREAGERLKLAAQVFDHTCEGIMVTDEANRIVSINKAFQALTGYGEEVLGHDPRILASERHSDEFFREMWDHLHQHGHWQGELWNLRPDGSEYLVQMNISISTKDAGGMNHVAVFSDITKQKEAQDNIVFMAHHDFLTGLPNRVLLEDRLAQLVARSEREGKGFAVGFLDLDRFKLVNDALGHDVGDKLLKEVAVRLQGAVRTTDTVSRQGGDEFVLLLTGLESPQNVAQVAAKIISRLGRPYWIDGHELSVTPSLGFSLFPADGRTPADLIKNADAAMYDAKNSGRNTFKFFTHELNAKILESLRIESSLRAAIPRELFVQYQPQLCLGTQAPLGGEALVRWRHPSLGLLSPDKFISIAESTGLIRELGRWVLEHSCQLIRETGIAVSVNLSPIQLAQKDILAVIRDAARGIEKNMLTIEITESALINDFDKTKTLLEDVRGLGVSIALDDFGTGYASLSYLRQLPIDYIKIDKSFITDISGRPIVLAIIGLANTMGMVTIAEGVETPEQIAFLERHGCGAIQGYYYSRPLDEDRFVDFIRENVKPVSRTILTPPRDVEPLLTWSFTFATGIDEIDRQHKVFIGLINGLNSGVSDESMLRGRLDELIAYFKYHIDYEGRLMTQYDVVDAPDHLRQHELFMRNLRKLASFSPRHEPSVVAGRLARFLCTWLTNHILQSDKNLGHSLKRAGCRE